MVSWIGLLNMYIFYQNYRVYFLAFPIIMKDK